MDNPAQLELPLCNGVCPACGDDLPEQLLCSSCGHDPIKLAFGSIQDLYRQHAAWAIATFGGNEVRGPIGPLKHLAKEVNECLKDPTDKMEYVDVMFLTWDAARRAGYTLDDLLIAGYEKLAIVKARKYPETRLENEPVEHIRS